MAEPVQQKSIREISEGDFLAEDITNAKGKVLLKKGTPLTPEHVKVLMAQRVFTVKVGTESQVKGGGIARMANPGEFEHMFEEHLDNPIMVALMNAAAELSTGGGDA